MTDHGEGDGQLNVNDDDELLSWMRLQLVPGVGPRLLQTLLDRFETPDAVLSASIAELQQVSGIGPKVAMAIATRGSAAEARTELEAARTANVSVLMRGRAGYPQNLLEAPDPPPILYAKGSWLPSDELAIAIVGTRRPSPYGQQQATRFASGLARAGITIVSGLARGIDALAHQAALEAGGRTVAVAGHGLKTIYPPEHGELGRRIEQNGCRISEYRLDQAPMPGLFPQRNRIISGLSLGVLVIEAGIDSGSLHTARHAVEQNRDVFVVPARLDQDSFAGSLRLIRDGATLVRGVDDVLESLGPLANPVVARPAIEPWASKGGKTAAASFERSVHHPREAMLNDQERRVLNAVPAEMTSIDEVLGQLDMEPSRTLATLTILEMKRLIRRLPGNMIVRQ